MARRLVVFVWLLAMMLVSPRQSEAAFVDFIVGLSGPQLIGIGAGCRWDFHLNRDVCDLGMAPAMIAADQASRASKPLFFFSVGGTYFFSTSKDGESGVPYGWNDVRMLAFEPSVSVRSVNQEGIKIHHGVGPTFDYLFGRHFDSFGKAGIRVTPAELVFPNQRFSVALTMRLYPNGFTDDEFGFGVRRDYDRPFEAVYGISAGYTFKKR